MSAGTLVRKVSKLAVAPAGVVTRRRSGDVVVLLYHRVGSGVTEIELSPHAFERQLQILREHERVLTLDDALSSPDGGVVVTFDDGTADFHRTVLPLLVRYRIPAVLYLATGLVVDEGGDGLTWAQLGECLASGLVTVGSHTHSHADLSRTTEAVAADEMHRSKDLIEDRLAVACEHFAYPWAVGSAAADRAARRHFRSAALGAWRTNRAGRIDPYRLGRTPVLRSDGAFFRAKARGYLDGEAWLYRAFGRGPWGRT